MCSWETKADGDQVLGSEEEMKKKKIEHSFYHKQKDFLDLKMQRSTLHNF